MICVDRCEWDDWIIGDCSVTCGGGIRTNIRPSKDSGHGPECEGPLSIIQSCNVDNCPGMCDISLNLH